MNIRDYHSIAERLNAVSRLTGVQPAAFSVHMPDEELASKRNNDLMIGYTTVPMGVAGPLLLHLQGCSLDSSNGLYVPLATTEGALVASVNRGCKVIRESGGVEIIVEQVGATRSPVFRTSSLSKAHQLKTWIYESLSKLNTVAQTTSHHIVLTGADVQCIGRDVYCRLIFDTKDAMGLNMVTIASDAIGHYIATETKCSLMLVAGNYDSDKKPAAVHMIAGRGKRVWAEVVIPDELVSSLLKTTSSALMDAWIVKCMVGSHFAGSIATNLQAANVFAAIAIATGQDPAHVVEASQTMTYLRRDEGKKNCIFSIYAPSLMVGTVGGGTQLTAQRTALSMLGVSGGDEGKNAVRFAAIVAGAMLAGEISLLASLSEGSLATTHQRLGRGKGDA